MRDLSPNAAEAMMAARQAGVTVMAEDGRLLLHSHGPISRHIIEALYRCRTEILELLNEMQQTRH